MLDAEAPSTSLPEPGLIVSVQAGGGMVAGLVVPRLITRRSPRLVIGLGFVLNGLFLASSLMAALVLFMVTGLPITAAYVDAGTHLQQAVTDERRGRVFDTLGTVQSAFLLLSASLGAVLGDQPGVIRVLASAALLNVAAGRGGAPVASGGASGRHLGRSGEHALSPGKPFPPGVFAPAA